jgi:hypothetical protein
MPFGFVLVDFRRLLCNRITHDEKVNRSRVFNLFCISSLELVSARYRTLTFLRTESKIQSPRKSIIINIIEIVEIIKILYKTPTLLIILSSLIQEYHVC